MGSTQSFKCLLGLVTKLLLLVDVFVVHAYPPSLPPAFAYTPSQQQMAMAAAGLEPIMPVNFPGMTPMTAVMQSKYGGAGLTSPVSLGSLYGGRGDGSAQQQQQLAMALAAQQQPHLFFRNSPFQPPIRGMTSTSPFFGVSGINGGMQHSSSLQQPIFPHGLAIGKTAFGAHPSATLLPSDIPMDVLIGRQQQQQQMFQNGLDDVGQTAAAASRHLHHPFPLESAFGGIVGQQAAEKNPAASSAASSFGGAFGGGGADPFQQQQKSQQSIAGGGGGGDDERLQELSRTERLPSSPSNNQVPPPQAPVPVPSQEANSAPPRPPPVISAEGSSSSSASLSSAGAASASSISNSGPGEQNAVESIPGQTSNGAASSGAASSSSQQSSLPVFLRGAPQEFIDEFKQIIRQPKSTYASQVGQLDALVQRMDPERQLLYREFMRENDDRERLHRDRVHKTVSEMSDKAQEQFAKISATLRNPNVPDQERWDRVLQLYGKMDTELRNEFEQKFKGFPTIGPANGV